MIPLFIIIALLINHWIADFIFQTHWMAVNKSRNIWALLAHVATYTVVLTTLTSPFFFPNFLLWALTNGVIHGMIDFVTSRITSYLWKRQDVHHFFVAIGLDQLLHYVTLFVSYLLLA